jgi:regulatory protein
VSARSSRPGAPDDPVAAAHTVALRLLTVRARSRAEVEARLRRKGFDAGTVDAALERLERAGLLDDKAFAADLAALRSERGVASALVRRELRARGIDPETAGRVAANPPGDEEAERCRALADAWVRRHGGLAPEVAARRLAGHLARRGYSASLVARTVRATIEIEVGLESD